jgi:predicted Zn-dependent protease
LRELAGIIEEAAQAAPQDIRWPKLLARLYLKASDDERLSDVLKKLAHNDPDNSIVRKKLAQLALAADDFTAAELWAQAACQSDLWDAAAHRFWGEALAGQKKYAAAIHELEVALQLDPDDGEAKDALADARQFAENASP